MCQLSTPKCNPLYQKRHTFLWKLMTKGEKLEQTYVNASFGEVEVGHGKWTKREQH